MVQITTLLPPANHHLTHPDEVLPLMNTPNHAPKYVTLAIFSFILSKSILRQVSPKAARVQGAVTVWKWVNTANSMLHSFVTGVGAVICLYLYPRVAENVISTYTDYSHCLVCYSVGYFIFDFFDMLINHRKRSSYELMVHHVFVLSCFILSISTRYYLAFTIISLVVEVNSIFLHWRQLLLITKANKKSLVYRIVSLLNLISFVIFRICTLAWMTRWMSSNSALVSPVPYLLGCVSLLGLLIMSAILFFRLLKADYNYVRGSSSSSSSKPLVNGFNNNSTKHD